MKTCLYFLLTLGFFQLLVSCNKDEDKPGCLPKSEVNQAEIALAFKDLATGRYLHSEVNPLYHKDSLMIFDLQGNRMAVNTSLDQIPNSSGRYWKMTLKSLYNTGTDAGSFNTQLCKTYVVKYTFNQTDTLIACFKSKQTDECSSVFETFKVFQKDALLGTATNSNTIFVTAVKN